MLRILILFIRIVDRTATVIGHVVSILVPAMVVVLGYEVVARYAFNAPTIWAHDLSIFMFGYLGMLSGVYAERRSRHITVDVIHVRLSPRGQAALDVTTGLLMFFFLGLIVIYGWEKAVDALRIDARMSTLWAPPKAHFMIMIPVSAAFLMLQGFANWIRSLYLALTGQRLET